MSNEKDKLTTQQILRHYQIECGPLNLIQKETLESSIAKALTTIRQEGRAAERKRVLDVIKRVPATAAGADAFRKRLIEELYVEAAANETREDKRHGPQA